MIEVFKTNITQQKKANQVIVKLKEVFPDYQINFDLEDCDNILRIENSKQEIEDEQIIQLIRGFGFCIEVLTET